MKKPPSQLHVIEISLAVLLLIFPSELGGTEEDLRRVFLEEAPRAWNEYSALTQHLQGDWKVYIASDGEVKVHNQGTTKLNKNCRLLLVESFLKDDPGTHAYGNNPKYSFSLHRKTPSSSWVLKTLSLKPAETDPTVQGALSGIEEGQSVLVHPFQVPLAVLVQQPTFRVLRAVRTHKKGEDLVRVDFDNTHPLADDSKTFVPIQGGSMLLDPKRYWILRAAEFRTKHSKIDGNAKIDIDIKDASDPFPIPKRCAIALELQIEGRGRAVNIFRREFVLHDPETLPADEDFRLTAFGLPEPPGVRWNKPAAVWLWVSLAAVTLIVIGAVFNWLKRRRLAATS
jgi:hypothetical protein